MACSKGVDYFFIVQQLCAFIFNGKHGNTLEFLFDTEFLTHVFMCLDKRNSVHMLPCLLAMQYCNNSNPVQFWECFLYRSRHEINANILFGFSTESSRFTISRFAWWSSWLKSVSFAPYASANGFKAVQSANFSLVGLRTWMPINTLQWLSVKRLSISPNKLSKTA